MTSPLQILYFIAITLAPSDAHHVHVTGGAETYGWNKTDSKSNASTWVQDGSIDPRRVLANNDIAPYDMAGAQKSIVRMERHQRNSHAVLIFDETHQLEQLGSGYVYVVRPGAPNQKTYSFTFTP